MNTELICQTTVLADFLKKKHPELRIGQSLMNALAEINLNLYKEITGTDNDPFYLDSRVPAFFEAIKALPPTDLEGLKMTEDSRQRLQQMFDSAEE